MEGIQLKKRCPNFSTSEQRILLQLVHKHSEVLNAKPSGATNLSRREAWENINSEFERLSGVKRGVTHLKTKYDNLKKVARKEHLRRETGGGVQSGVLKTEKSNDTLTTLAGIGSAACLGDSLAEGNETKEAKGSGVFFITTERDPLIDGYEEESCTLEAEKPKEETEAYGYDTESHDDTNSCSTYDHVECGAIHEEKQNSAAFVKSKAEISQTEVNFEKIKLIQAQRIFYENEDKRAREKHEWERQQAEVKYKVLNSELLLKLRQLENNKL